MDGKRVDTRRQFTGEGLVDHAVALKPALTFEGLGYDINPKMRLSARLMSGVPLMLMRFVHDPDAVGGKSLSQLSCDDVLDAHDGCRVLCLAKFVSPGGTFDTNFGRSKGRE
jgi:hypothetical protein